MLLVNKYERDKKERVERGCKIINGGGESGDW